MKQELTNLTTSLICEHHLWDVREHFGNDEDFLKFVFETLTVHNTADMTAETCGRIVGNMELGNVLLTSDQVSKMVPFCGNPVEYLKELNALFLAAICVARLNPNQCDEDIPQFRRPRR